MSQWIADLYLDVFPFTFFSHCRLGNLAGGGPLYVLYKHPVMLFKSEVSFYICTHKGRKKPYSLAEQVCKKLANHSFFFRQKAKTIYEYIYVFRHT